MSLFDHLDFSALKVPEEELQRQAAMSGVKCKTCSQELTVGESECSGICCDCHFAELEKQNELNLSGEY